MERPIHDEWIRPTGGRRPAADATGGFMGVLDARIAVTTDPTERSRLERFRGVLTEAAVTGGLLRSSLSGTLTDWGLRSERILSRPRGTRASRHVLRHRKRATLRP
jgi:hypothetical protein